MRFLAPVPDPPSIRDFYAFEEHVKTSAQALGREVSPVWYEIPLFYFTNPAATRGPCDDIPVTPGSARFDYELEIAAVVGRPGSDLDPAVAERHIAGYMVMCDWSARDLQAQEMAGRLGPAKGKDSATSFSAFLVTPDELEDRRAGNAYDLEMTASVNGRPYSSGDVLGHLLAIRRAARVRVTGHDPAQRRHHRQRHRRDRVHPGAVRGARARRLPVAAAGRPGPAGGGSPRRHQQHDPARCAGNTAAPLSTSTACWPCQCRTACIMLVMRLSARADYALRASIEIASIGEGHVTADQVARTQQIPVKFLETILTQLRRAGLVRSQRGPDGGFWLARPAEEILARRHHQGHRRPASGRAG